MKHLGRVMEIHGRTALVEIETGTGNSCGGCELRGHCSGTEGNARMRVQARIGSCMELRLGDAVEVRPARRGTALAATLLGVVPLAAFAVTLGLSLACGLSEAMAAAAATAMTAAAFAAAHAVSARSPVWVIEVRSLSIQNT